MIHVLAEVERSLRIVMAEAFKNNYRVCSISIDILQALFTM
jgi:hypothetical protein